MKGFSTGLIDTCTIFYATPHFSGAGTLYSSATLSQQREISLEYQLDSFFPAEIFF